MSCLELSDFEAEGRAAGRFSAIPESEVSK